MTPPRGRHPAGQSAGWLLLGAIALDLAARSVARRSFLQPILGAWAGPWLLVAIAAAAAAVLARRRPTRATALLFAVLFAAGAAAQLQLGARLQSDGFYYFAYLRSIAFDGDVNFTNDYKLLGLGDKPHLFQPTPTGYAQSAWTIGPAIAWAPFFAAAHGVAARLSTTDPNVSANGTSFPYRQAVCVAGLVYGLLGCWFCSRLAARFYPRPVAAAATIFVVAGSFMLWYIVKEPSMTHAPSMAAVAGFTWAWAATRDRRTPTQWALLGALAGLMTLVRWQNAIFVLLPACDSAAALATAWRTTDRRALRRALLDGLLFTACATAAFLPQMIAWRSIYGSWLAVSPIGPQIRWGDPHLVDILWSSRNGLLSWSPALYVALAGLIVFAIRRPADGLPMLLAFAAMTYFNATIQDWWGSAGFGGRRFDGTIPLLCVGGAAAATVAAGYVQRHPLRAAAAAGAALVLWNLTLMSVANDGIVRIGESVSYGDAFAAQARAAHRWVGNPFTYPASLAFALRNGVSPDRYDLLSANRFLGDPLRPYGRIDVGADDGWLLEAGWHDREREGHTTFRWAAREAVVLVPLDHAATLRVQLRLQPLGYAGAPPQQVTLLVNGDAQPVAAVPGGWNTVELTVERRHWRAGVNRVGLRFASSARPADVGLGRDTRDLAAQVDYVRVTK